MSECRICGIAHDREVHAATLRLRRWLKKRIERALNPPPRPPKPTTKTLPQIVLRGTGRP
jgi:hypothetical protein